MIGGGSGFLDATAARMALKRIRLRNALGDIQALIPALLNALNQTRDAGRDAIVAPVQRGIELGQGDLESRVGGQAVNGVEGEDVGEEQLLEGADLVLQFLNSLLVHVGQGRFSINLNTPDASAAEQAVHRLSQGEK